MLKSGQIGLRWSVAAATALAIVAALACGGAEKAAAPGPAAAGVAAPAPAPVAPIAAPGAAPAAGTVPSTCIAVAEQVTDCPERSPHTWRSAPSVPGEYWGYNQYSGPRPTKFYESPMSYQLVNAGLLPPVGQRLPRPDDVKVIQAPDNIGEYGGMYRLTANFLFLGEFSLGSWYERDSNGIAWHPHIGKSFQISENGRVYTFTLRRDLKWSDGTPFTMDDVRFAWEDLNNNRELNPTISLEYRDLVSGEPAKFGVLDEHNWTLTFDTPVFNVMELRSNAGAHCSGGGRMCFFSPPYMRQFHPEYANPAELQMSIVQNAVEDWVQLWKLKTNFETNAEKPCARAWCVEANAPLVRVGSRNHYFFAVDPEGNQMPYIDKVKMIRMESREVAVFRSMAGENDGQTTLFRVPEVPLYVNNMVKGDYSVYNWPSTAGSDYGLSFNVDYNKDPEIGKWIRTQKFRNALSHATDRDAINEGVLLGAGTPQNFIPHPSTPYYPGPELTGLHTEYDVDLANRMLDEIGLTARDSDGFRLRTDGSGRRLTLKIQLSSAAGGGGPGTIANLVRDMWVKVGIELRINVRDSVYNPIRTAQAYLGFGGGGYISNPWSVLGGELVPVGAGSGTASEIGRWVETLGQKGTPPKPDPSFLPLAPPDTFPSDTSGSLKRLIAMWNDGRGHAMYSPERIEIGKELFRINAEEQRSIATVAFTGSFRGTFLNRNNVKNQPQTHFTDHYGYNAWTYYFEDGIDNINHHGNKSKYSKSVGFVGG